MKAYEYYKKIGICPHCRQYKPAEGKVYCPNCLDEQATLQMIRRAKISEEEKQADRAKQRENAKIRYKERKAQGICVECGKRRARKNRTKCAMCADKDTERVIHKYWRNKDDN